MNAFTHLIESNVLATCIVLSLLLMVLLIAWTFEKVGRDTDQENEENQ